MSRKCHAKVRQYGHSHTGRFRALCACGWKGAYFPSRELVGLTAAMGEAKRHDPKYPRGTKPSDLP